MKIIKNKYGEFRPWVSIVLTLLATGLASMLLNMLVGFLVLQLGLAQGPPMMAISFISMILNYAVLAFVAVGAFRLFYRRPWREMGFAKTGAVAQCVLGLVFGAVSIAVVAGILVLSGQARVTEIVPSRMLAFPFWAGLVQFILVGIYEELLSRGFMMTALKTSRSKALVMLLPAFLFAALHLANAHVTFLSLANIMLVGLLFAYLMIKTGAIWASIGYHITWNFVQGNVLGIAVSGGARQGVMSIESTGAEWLTGGTFGAEGGAVCTLVILLGLLFIRFCVKSPAERPWTFESGLPMPAPIPNRKDV